MTEDALRDAIIHEIGKNWFVQAGAGAGKTRIIVERIIEQLKSGQFLPENIVVITFTRKAAGELSERIVKRLQDIMDENSKEALNDEEKKNLKNALENIERMNISTIHSFCYKLLMGRSFEAGIPLDAVMLEENAAVLAKKRIFSEWYRRIGYSRYIKLKEQDEKPGKSLFELFCRIADLPKDTNVVYDQSILDAGFDEEAEGRKVLKDYFSLLLDKINEISGKNYAVLEETFNEPFIRVPFKKIVLSLPEKGAYKVLKALHTKDNAKQCFKKKKGLLEQDDAPLFNNEIYTAMDEQVSAFFDRRRSYIHALFVSMALEAREYYNRQKDPHFLTNDDLLQKAGALVRKSPKARAAFMKQYRCIYVDEFQDTDHVQAEMILNLCGEKIDAKHYRLRPGNLFIVGDPKQSIYRFRGAELDVFYRVREIFSDPQYENGCIASLHWNFRSNPILLNEWINPNFERRFKGLFQDPSMIFPAEQENKISDDDTIVRGVYVSKNASRSADSKLKYQAEADALACCHLIKSLVYGKKKIKDKNVEGGYRPIRFSDFLILSRNKMSSKYYQVFMHAQIPIDVSGKIDLSIKRIFNRYLRVYKGLVLPFDPLARAGAEEILKELGYANTKKQFDELREKYRDVDGIAMAHALMQHPEWYCDRDEVIDRSAIMTSQAQLIQMIETVMASVPNDGARLADAFEAYMHQTLEQQLKLSENINAVRIMNLHKAKGLEGNIVLIAMRNEDTGFKSDTYQERTADGNVYHQTFKLNNQKISGYAADSEIWEKARNAEEEENMRLEYVAATRAREALIFMDALSDSCAFLKDFDFDNCAALESLLEEDFWEDPAAWFVELKADGRDHRAQLDESQKKPVMMALSPSNFEKHADVVDEGEKEDRPKGNIFGNMLHRTFELLVPQIRENTEINSAVPVKRAIMEYMGELSFANEAEKQDDLKKIEAYLLQCAADFVNDPILTASIQQADEVLTELPFGYTLSKGDAADFFADMRPWLKGNEMTCCDDQKIYIHGFSDLILICQDDNDRKVIIVDYKSDVRNGLNHLAFDEILRKRYAGQMTLYRHAISHVLQVPKDKISVVIRDLYGGWVKI